MIHSLLLILTLCQTAQEPSREIQAAMFLGSRSAQVQRKLPVIKQVVIVPDEATYLDEIGRWSTRARWPVLFDKEPFTSQFIRRFKPEKVWVRESIGTKIEDKERAMEQAVAKAWDGVASIEIALTDLKIPPIGIVLTATDDPARMGAVALAAGRGQLLKCMSSDWGSGQETLSASDTSALIREIDDILASTGLKYADLGDTIDAITICQNMASRAEFIRTNDNPVAISDVIGRDATGKRFAWTGWVLGPGPRTTYLAMCSLFLPRDQYWFCNTYANSGGWAKYGFGTIEEVLPEYGIHSEVIEGTLTAMQQADVGGIVSDVAYFTTKGNPDFLDMADVRTAPSWLPILNTPSALYFLHSWSLKNPSVKTTVGGIWLSRGVYAYIGSSHEPMLTAFVPPTEMLRKTMSLIPFLVAARWADRENMFSKAWRVNTIGDPLMLCPPKGVVQRKLLPPLQQPDYQSVSSLAQNVMRLAIESPRDESFSVAINTVNLLGLDSMSSELWFAATKSSATGPLTAKAALPALFRLQNDDAFLWAFSLVDSPSRLERDMLWQLVGTKQDTPLQLLVDNVRNPYSYDDLIVIADRIAATRGSSAVKNIIDEKLNKATGRNKRSLQKMRKEYGG